MYTCNFILFYFILCPIIPEIDWTKKKRCAWNGYFFIFLIVRIRVRMNVATINIFTSFYSFSRRINQAGAGFGREVPNITAVFRNTSFPAS